MTDGPMHPPMPAYPPVDSPLLDLIHVGSEVRIRRARFSPWLSNMYGLTSAAPVKKEPSAETRQR